MYIFRLKRPEKKPRPQLPEEVTKLLKEDGPKVTIPHGRKGLHFLSFYLFVSKESLIPETLSEMKTQKQQQQQQDITPNEVRTAQDIRRLGSKASAKEERLRRQDESFIIPNGKNFPFLI